MKFANRMNFLGAEGFRSVLAEVEQLRASGRRLIPMHAGEPDFDTPKPVVEAAVRALRNGDTHYVPAAGIPSLRAAVAREITDSHKVPVSADQVVIAPGAKPLIHLVLSALCDPGDEVICPDPGYPIYASLAAFLGANPVSLPLNMETRFSFEPDKLRSLITPRTRLIVLNSPSNPTGGVLDSAALAVIAAIAEEHDLYVLCDEIYSHLVYDDDFSSVYSLPGMAERTIIVDGYSKRFAMTGWRLGYGIMPRPLAAQLTRLMLNILSCTTSFIQPAGIVALEESRAAVSDMKDEFGRRRDQILKGLNNISAFECLPPQGAFYAFPRFQGLKMSSAELSQHLLRSAGVVTYPGSAFGPGGEGFIRFSFACSEETIARGLERVAAAIGEL